MKRRPAFTSDIPGILALGDGIDANIETNVRAGQVFVMVNCQDFVGAAVAAVPADGVHYIASMVVHEPWRGKGVGRDLMNYVKECVDTPLVAIAKAESVGFWERCGFKETGALLEHA